MLSFVISTDICINLCNVISKSKEKDFTLLRLLKRKTVKESNCVPPYLDVLRDLVSALLMTSEGADCRL